MNETILSYKFKELKNVEGFFFRVVYWIFFLYFQLWINEELKTD